MSRAPFVIPKTETAFPSHAEVHDTTIGWRFAHARIAATHSTETMPGTAENLAALHRINRADQDACAHRSQSLYAAAWHAADIAPVNLAGPKGTTLLATDEHPRLTSLEKLRLLPAPFRTDGTVTAGNASGINDGAAAILLASGAALVRHGLTPLARIGAGASAGVPPRTMGAGAIAALHRLQQQNRLSPADYDVIELNEAFAAQVLACTRAWGPPDDAPQVNRHGGAIALGHPPGHPPGMSGARIALHASRQLLETGGKDTLVTLCFAVGQGVAVALHAP